VSTTLILWLWPVVVLGSVALFGLYLTHRDQRDREPPTPNPAE
jgi:cytochrome c-type biogenesis protein CcmH/NrfF